MLKRTKDGAFASIVSASDALLARERIDAIRETVARLARKAGIPTLVQEQTELQKVLDAYVMRHEGFENDNWKATRVQGHSRSYDAEMLRDILPAPIFAQITAITINSAKVDELVRAGKIDVDVIEPALIETPNKPYLKWTPKSERAHDKGLAEADKLAKMLA